MKALPTKVSSILAIFSSMQCILGNHSSVTMKIEYNIEKAMQEEMQDTETGYTFLIASGLRDYAVLDKYLPYMVSIRSRYPQKYFGDNHFCGGTIIGMNLVLTAAHCVMDKRRVLTSPRRMLVVAGTPNRLERTESTMQFPVSSIKANTNFIRYGIDDIAIIRLKSNIPLDNENIKILRLPNGPPNPGTNCLILGWGRLCKDGPLPALATHINVKLYTEQLCYEYLRFKLAAGVMCAGDKQEYTSDPCRGDSGGPLICNDALTGIISWTIGCNSIIPVGLYTDVWHYRKWINDNLNEGSNFVLKNGKILIIVVALSLTSL